MNFEIVTCFSCVHVVGTGLLFVAPLVPGTGVGSLAGLPGLVPGPVPGPVGPSRSGRVPPEPSVVVSPFWALPERSLNLFLGWKSSLSSSSFWPGWGCKGKCYNFPLRIQDQ